MEPTQHLQEALGSLRAIELIGTEFEDAEDALLHVMRELETLMSDHFDLYVDA